MVHALVETYVDRIPWYEAHQRYWCPCSERYAPAEVLVAYLHDGWELDKRVTVERVHFGSSRYVEIYHFVLRRAGISIEMPVIANPVAVCIVQSYPAMVQCEVKTVPVRCPATNDLAPSLMDIPADIWPARSSENR